MEGILQNVSLILSNGLVLYFVQRHFNNKDKKREEEKRFDDELKKKVEVGLETIRLLAYTRMSHEIERLKSKGYATLQDRVFLKELYDNYKQHNWNGDMDAGMEDVRNLPTNPPDA